MLKYSYWSVTTHVGSQSNLKCVEMNGEVFDNFVYLVWWCVVWRVSGVLTFQEQADPGIVKLTDYRMHLTQL